jgi:hypothetical protein
MKTADQIKPNYAPVYCAALYPDLCKIFQSLGYALAVHGSLARDFDIIAIPWTKDASDPEDVFKAIHEARFIVKVIGEPEKKLHDRIAYTISIGFGECACDLSFMPIVKIPEVT